MSGGFRWVFKSENLTALVKVAVRPIIEEEISFLNQKQWIPGKKSPQQISLVFFEKNDLQEGDIGNVSLELWTRPSMGMMGMLSCGPCPKCGYKAPTQNYGPEILEKWDLTGVKILKVTKGFECYAESTFTTEVLIEYTDVSYKSKQDIKKECVNIKDPFKKK